MSAARIVGQTTVHFEGVEPYTFYSCRISFYALVKYDDADNWEIIEYQRNERGDRVFESSTFSDLCEDCARSDAGKERIRKHIRAFEEAEECDRRFELAQADWHARGCPPILGGVR